MGKDLDLDPCYSNMYSLDQSALASPECLLEMQNLGLPPDLMNHNLHFNKIPKQLICILKVRISGLFCIFHIILAVPFVANHLFHDMTCGVRALTVAWFGNSRKTGIRAQYRTIKQNNKNNNKTGLGIIGTVFLKNDLFFSNSSNWCFFFPLSGTMISSNAMHAPFFLGCFYSFLICQVPLPLVQVWSYDTLRPTVVRADTFEWGQ